MDSLPPTTRQPDNLCPICLESLNSSEFARKPVSSALPCRHLFHASCIDDWTAEHITCPVGQRVIVSVELQLRLPPGWQTLLLNSASNGQHDQVLALLKRGAHADAGRKYAHTPFFLAASNKHISTAQLLADHGSTDPYAQFLMGNLYLKGEGVKQDLSRAFWWFLKSAVQNYVNSQHMIGAFYLRGWGRRSNTTHAISWLQKAVDQNCSHSMALLASIYLGDNPLTRNISKGLELLHKAAQNGSEIAMNQLGLLYLQGTHVKVDNAKAQHFLQQAVKQNFIPAQIHLAWFYLRRGDKEKLPQIIDLLKRAADRGCQEAMTLLGITYQYRLRDSVYAFDWFHRAARLGEHSSHYHLGLMYEAGKGTHKDQARAHHHYQQAAEQANTYAQFRLGVIYSLGLGIPKDLNKARHWFGEAAANGHPGARARMNQIPQPTSDQAPTPVTKAKKLKRLQKKAKPLRLVTLTPVKPPATPSI